MAAPPRPPSTIAPSPLFGRGARRTLSVLTRPPKLLPFPPPPPKRPADPSRPPVASAGYAFGIGLICFALWLFFDARQLFNSANASPLGARRSAAMTFLRPVARIEEFFGADRIVDGGNRALGRGTPAIPHQMTGASRSATTTIPPSTTTTTLPPQTAPAVALAPPHILFTEPNRVLVKISQPPPPRLGPPALVQPTAARPLTILDVGDSIGEDLGYGLDNVLGANHEIHLVLASQESTGLVDPSYFNWPAHLAADLRQYHPKLVVVMLGANDWNGLLQGNVGLPAGSAEWRRVYAERVARMMSEATSSGAHVVWVGMPIMANPTFSSDMKVLDSIFESEAHRHPGVAYVSTWKLFSNKSGHYLTYVSRPGGLVQVRASDGVHIALPGGGEYIGSYVVREIEAGLRIRL